MSKRPTKHRTKVRKYNRYPGSPMSGPKNYWWSECSCGWYNGWHNKLDAQLSAKLHLSKVGGE